MAADYSSQDRGDPGNDWIDTPATTLIQEAHIERVRRGLAAEPYQPLASCKQQRPLPSVRFPPGYPAEVQIEVYRDVQRNRLAHSRVAEIVLECDRCKVKPSFIHGPLLERAASKLPGTIQAHMCLLSSLHTLKAANCADALQSYVVLRLTAESDSAEKVESIASGFGDTLERFLDEAELLKALTPVQNPFLAAQVKSWELQMMRGDESLVAIHQGDSPLWSHPEREPGSLFDPDPVFRMLAGSAYAGEKPSMLAACVSLNATPKLPFRLYARGLFAERLDKSPNFVLVQNDRFAYGEAAAFENEQSISPLAILCHFIGILGIG